MPIEYLIILVIILQVIFLVLFFLRKNNEQEKAFLQTELARMSKQLQVALAQSRGQASENLTNQF